LADRVSKVVKPLIGVAITFVGFVTGNGYLVAAGLSIVSESLAKKPKAPRPQFDVQYSGTLEPRRLGYGQLKMAGMHVIPAWTSGDNNKFLHSVQALVAHEIEGITDWYFNQETIAAADIGAVSGALTDGAVGGSGPYAEKAWLRGYLGTDSQTVDFILDSAFTQWTSNHRGRGVAYIAAQLEMDEKVYKNGAPTISCLAKLKKCYDPRLDASPGAAPTNPSFIAWTQNPALCLADYWIDVDVGCKIPAERIDWALVVAAADICDEDVLIPPASPTTEQKRYTCNVSLFVAADEEQRRENIKVLVGAMAGYCCYRGGLYRMYAGAAQTPSFALTADDLVGRISVQTHIPADRRYNFVHGQFVDPARNYQFVPFEPRSNSTYETDDGDRFALEVEFPACAVQYEAQRNAIAILKRSRRWKTISGTWGWQVFDVRPGDWGTITIPEWGLNGLSVRCETWERTSIFAVEASFVEEIASDWDDPAVGDYGVPSVTNGPTSGDFVPSPPQNFTATPIQDGILFQWDPPDDAPPGTRYRISEYTSATPFSSATPVASNLTGTSRTIIKADTTTRYYWIEAQAHFSNDYSDEAPSGDGIPGAALAITTGFRATVSPGNLHRTLVGASSGNTTGQATVTPINGVPGYTYAWTRISGDTTITAIASTSATTGFNNTGMVDQETNAAQFRCRVTDSTGGTPLTYDVFVMVTFFRDDSFGS
jgi:hypothetical protein